MRFASITSVVVANFSLRFSFGILFAALTQDVFLYNPMISFTMRSLIFTAPTSTSRLNTSSPM